MKTQEQVLVLVDCQNDFFEGGNLAVPNSLKIIPYINKLLEKKWHEIVVTQDWHPSNHTSFASNHNVEPFTIIGGEVKWPVHTIQNTHGAEIHKDIRFHIKHLKKWANVVRKGEVFDKEEYGAGKFINLDRVESFYLVGLATDYCVLHTAKELKELRNNVTVDLTGCAGVAEETTKQAIEEMKSLGINITGELSDSK